MQELYKKRIKIHKKQIYYLFQKYHMVKYSFRLNKTTGNIMILTCEKTNKNIALIVDSMAFCLDGAVSEGVISVPSITVSEDELNNRIEDFLA